VTIGYRGGNAFASAVSFFRFGMLSLVRFAAFSLFLTVAAATCAAELQPWTGGPPPGLRLKDLGGRLHRLVDYRGSVVLVNFWATWCEPCRDEMPSMQRLKTKLAGRPFVVLAVNLGEPESRIRKFLSERKLGLTVLLDPGMRAAEAWNARILPASFVIGSDGRIRYHVIGGLDWSSKRVAAIVSNLVGTK